jgi:hypothetical protein
VPVHATLTGLNRDSGMDEASVQTAGSGCWQGKSIVWHGYTRASCTATYVWLGKSCGQWLPLLDVYEADW